MLARGALAPLARRDSAMIVCANALRSGYGAGAVALTDSGTSALVLALRLLAGGGGTVALPAYSCVDLVAAARFAGVRVRLYDLDPATLSPDLESVTRSMRRGVDALIVAHLFGYPADIATVSEIAGTYGVPVIEDAAQAAGSTLHGRAVGGLGDVSVLSFGRGKGITSGHGGALMALSPHWAEPIREAGARLGRGKSGWGDAAAATAQWILGRPALYALPSSIPALRLGEMVYHPAREPASLSLAAAAMLERALAGADAETTRRRQNGRRLERIAEHAVGARTVSPIAGADPGYLRFPVIDDSGRSPAPALGILRGYPGTLADQPELAPCLVQGERAGAGATLLGRSLFTIPTHGGVTHADLESQADWLQGASVRVEVPEWAHAHP